MTLLENVIMIIVLVVALIMFYGVINQESNISAGLGEAEIHKEVAKEISKEIEKIVKNNPEEIDTEIEEYLESVEATKGVMFKDYKRDNQGIYVKIRYKTGSEFNLYKTVGVTE